MGYLLGYEERGSSFYCGGFLEKRWVFGCFEVDRVVDGGCFGFDISLGDGLGDIVI